MSTLQASKRHNGFTLVEMLVVIATTSMVCALATSLIFTMFRAEQAQTRDANERLAIQRLGDQFRRDVHAAEATAVSAAEEGVLLRLPLGDNSEVTYREAGANIVREVHRVGEIARHDTFRVADRWQVSFAPHETENLWQMWLVRKAVTERTRAPHRWQFDAARGSDHRHNTSVNTPDP